MRGSCFYLAFAAAAALTTHAGEPLAKVPLEIRNGQVFVEVNIKGRPLRLSIDAEANGLWLEEQTAVELGFQKSVTGVQSFGAGPLNTPPHVQLVEYSIGQVKLATQLNTASYLSPDLKPSGDGSFGRQLFELFVVELDYPRGELRIHSPEDFQPPKSGQMISIQPAEMGPQVRAKLFPGAGAEPIEGNFGVSTGSTAPDLMLTKECGDKLGRPKPQPPQGAASAGGSYASAFPVSIESLQIGELVISNPNTIELDLVLPGIPLPSQCGTIEAGALRRFNVIFDVPHKRLFLVE